MYGRELEKLVARFFAVLAVVCIAIGVALACGVPWLWSILKPLIHTWTA